MKKVRSITTSRLALLAGAAIVTPSAAFAQTPSEQAPPSPSDAATAAASGDGEIIVTATRRNSTVQSAPINIAAIGADLIEKQRLQNLREIVRQVPGIYIPDTGARNGSPIVFRGLNADPLGSGDGNNDGGGTVATYVGEIPLYVDLRLNDMERVEFLAGPQGTLYGAGTLGGAVRYIPARPKFDEYTVQVRGETYAYGTNNSGFNYNAGMTVNLPLTANLAFRASLDRLDDRGFVNQPYVVNQIGVSNPDPNFSDPADVRANTHREKGVNNDRVWSSRAALRWKPTDTLDVNLTWYHQNEITDGRQISGQLVDTFPVSVGKYDNLKRVLEPNRRTNDLVSLEIYADLGFATLTSATGRSWFKDFGHRDQTDLLIGLEYSYEAFPSFTAFTTERDDEKNFTQEVRLVSQGESRFNWIVGGFYNKRDGDGYSKEFTPGYSEYLVNEAGFPGPTRPDNLEYYSVTKSKVEEAAGYGELGYRLTDKWQVTLGGRYYYYNIRSQSATDLPLFDTVSGNRAPTDIVLDFQPANQSDNGFLFKANTSYKFTPDVLAYATFSQGYRIGNSNGLVLCSGTGTQQNVCAQPNELAYKPDKTNNYELGLKTQWLDKKLTVNVAGYYIDWTNPQIASATQVGLSPITVNGSGARSMGMEALIAARPTSHLSLRATYAYTDPQLTKTAVRLVPFITPPGFQSTVDYADGQKGDRLPGSPHHSGSWNATYTLPIGDDKTVDLSYTGTGQSNVSTRTGNLGDGYVLPGFTRHDISASVASKAQGWSLTLYVDNLFDNFAATGVSATPAYNQTVPDQNGGTHYVRTFYTYVLPPRTFGLRLVKDFGS